MLNFAEILHLERPLAVLDLETTGFDPDKDRVIQLAITLHYVNREPIKWASLVNPLCPILNAKESHGITDEMVANAPTFAAMGPVLAPKLLNVDIAGYNVVFDIAFLRAEMQRCGAHWPWDGYTIDAYQIFRRMRPLTLGNAYVEYGGPHGTPLPEGTKLEGAHDAGVDVDATEMVLRGQLQRYPELPRTVRELSEFCFPPKPNAIDKEGKFVWNDAGVPCIAFGKHGKFTPKPMKDVPRDYWKFILDNSFPPDIKALAAGAIAGKYPEKGLL